VGRRPLSLYINGVLNAQATPGATPWDSGCAFHIGGFYDPDGGCAYVGQFFNGTIDDVSYYAVALSADNVAALFAADSVGKCPVQPPCIITQPQGQRVPLGASATLSVWAIGMGSISYQWRLNGADVLGATDSTLNLTSAQLASSGPYTVVVSNPYGSISSSEAVLTVYDPVCIPAPAGLIGWWAGEGNALDSLCANNATLQNGVGFGAAMVGNGFAFDGNNQAVEIPCSAGQANLATPNYSVETWVCPTAQVSDPINQALIFGQNCGHCQLVVRPGAVGLRVAFQFGADFYTFPQVVSTREIPIGRFTHIAGTWDGTTLSLYLDGALDAQSTPEAVPWDSGCAFHIGGLYDPEGDYAYVGQFFHGLVDEVSIYNTALSAGDIQAIYLAGAAGKCQPQSNPSISNQPASQSVTAGENVTFSVVASSPLSLSYQWTFNGSSIAGATGSSYTKNNVQPADAGTYAVVVKSLAGTVVRGQTVSANAVLTVIVPPAITTQPASQTVMEGSVATFSVAASGSTPLSYQWNLNGEGIGGATASSFTTEALDMTASGRIYSVRVANGAGFVASAGALLRVVECDPATRPLAVDAWKTNCEDKFYFSVQNLSGSPLAGGQFDLYVYFDGANRTFYRNLQSWGPSDVLATGNTHLFTFCASDHSITNFDCHIIYHGGGTCAASPAFRIAVREALALVMTNTTQIANPCLECNNCPQDAPSTIAPKSRPVEDQEHGVTNCVPDPCGDWPQPLPASSSVVGAAKQLDDFYKPTDPPEHVGVGCPKTGFKNVYAIKQWHGAPGPKSSMLSAVAQMNGDCSCLTRPAPQNTPDTTKYLRKITTGSYTYSSAWYIYGPPSSGSADVSSDCQVGRYTGRLQGSATESGDNFARGGAWSAIQDVTLADLPNTYCQRLGEYAEMLTMYGVPVQPTYSSEGTTASMSWHYRWDNGYMTGLVEVDLVGGSFHCQYATGGADWVEEEAETITIGETQVSTVYSYNRSLDTDPPTYDIISSSGTVTYSDPYSSTDVNSDCDTLLAQWNLLDDLQYPWRADGGVTRGPLVTYNERTHVAPGILSPGFVDTSLPPWPSQPEGAVLGAPLPAHGPGGEIYSYQPYFNFYHKNWVFRESERGHPYGSITNLGASSPFPNATQWIDDDQARCLPGGPFWAYGSEVEDWNHAMFRFKDPYITDTGGVYEQGGYGAGCLTKCKWAETLTSPAPPGNDFVFKDWTFNFRDFFESYWWNAGAWYRNNNDTSCPGLSGCAPVRFTPSIVPPGQPGAGYYIDPSRSSLWISNMTCLALHYDYDCCRPAVYVQPDSPNADCTSSTFVPMPPAVCDAKYGSLWMGRVDQSTSDAHACDNYVANRNSGVANLPACDPQIELDLLFHGPGGYETFVAPLAFTPGNGPQRLPVDLDIDSDNNNGFGPPDRSAYEDAIEDDPGLPGKIIAVNDADANENGIPGFAEGFSWGGGGEASNDRFVPLVLEIPSDVNIADCQLRITYSASDPSGVTHAGTPVLWQPAPGNLRIWTKDGNQPRDMNSANDPDWPGDYVEPGLYSDVTTLGFSTDTRVVTFYVEGIAPSALGALEIAATLYADGTPPRSLGRDAVRVTVVKVNLDIARKNGTPVPHDQKQSNGSVVQLVPQVNPGNLYPEGIFLNIPNLSITPATVANLVTLKLKKVGPSTSQGKIRVYSDGLVGPFLDEDDTEATLTAADLSSTWWLDSTKGGVVDLALVAEIPPGVEFGRSTVRISSIPVEPADGRILFVNPASTSPQWPYDSFVRNAAQDVYTAVMQMQAGDNVLIAQGTYLENTIPVFNSGVIAGLGGQWSVADPTQSATPLADVFDYASLPVLDGSGDLPETLFDPASIFSGASTYGGLVLRNGTYSPSSTDKSGGAIQVLDTGLPVRIRYCDFQNNTAFDFGGAIYLSAATDVQISASRFTNNKAEHMPQGVVYDRGMGGAIASIESSLAVSNSVFSDNSALVASGDYPPPAGSAGGGGDIYVRNGSFSIVHSRSANAVAGYAVDPTDPGDGSGSAYFTGDGGAILVHGQGSGALIQILDSQFSQSMAYGNGGAISLSYDSSPDGRAYYVGPGLLWPPYEWAPEVLGGVCSGVISGVTFDHAQGGWQGGAISANGRGMNLTIQNCNFSGCAAGATHLRDGKGGAVSVAGGLQWWTSPADNIIVHDCTASSCTASGNGGGLYVTIRGQLQIVNSTITSCRARNGAGDLFRQTEGMGGGVHASAGGYVYLSGGTTLDANIAKVSGGGLSVKSGRAYFDVAVNITGNWAFGSPADGYGNGGGVFVTTSVWDDPVGGPGWGAATVYQEQGWLSGNFLSSTIEGNTASRWGGGIYAGISPPWYNPPWYGPAYDAAKVSPLFCTIRNNMALANANGRTLAPSQVAGERLAHTGSGTDALLDLTGASISGSSLDIGIYGWDSVAPISSGVVWGASLGAQVISDCP
jgi:Concanavalin A-like lectin/glucanases superfamily/Immunoglobulin domain